MPDLAAETLITRNGDMLATEVDGETVLMDVATGKYFGLARTSQAIWTMLEHPIRFGVLCSRLQARYAGSPEAIAADTSRFVQHLAQQHLVTLS
jgi:hypothetical protein